MSFQNTSYDAVDSRSLSHMTAGDKYKKKSALRRNKEKKSFIDETRFYFFKFNIVPITKKLLQTAERLGTLKKCEKIISFRLFFVLVPLPQLYL